MIKSFKLYLLFAESFLPLIVSVTPSIRNRRIRTRECNCLARKLMNLKISDISNYFSTQILITATASRRNQNRLGIHFHKFAEYKQKSSLFHIGTKHRHLIHLTRSSRTSSEYKNSRQATIKSITISRLYLY